MSIVKIEEVKSAKRSGGRPPSEVNKNINIAHKKNFKKVFKFSF